MGCLLLNLLSVHVSDTDHGTPGGAQFLLTASPSANNNWQFGRNVRSKPELLDVRHLSGGGLLLELAIETDPKVAWRQSYQKIHVRSRE